MSARLFFVVQLSISICYKYVCTNKRMHVCISRHTQCSNMVVATAGMYRTLLCMGRVWPPEKYYIHPNFFSLFSDHISRRCSSFCEGGVANNVLAAWRSGRGYSDHRVMRRNTSWIQYEYHERKVYWLVLVACWGWLHDNNRYTQGRVGSRRSI